MAEQGAIPLDRLYARLPAPASEALRRTLAVAARHAIHVFLVGGAVRDLLLDAPAELDLDLVVEGEALSLAKAAGAELHARVVTHARFGTAVLRGEGYRIDLARARSERYERPGALPMVQPATLGEDLGRRDFTINAIALRLTGARAGELLDPYGGQTDLRRKVVRVLHERSFQDDATRILRALRYAGRYGFALETETARWLRRDLGYFETISGARLRREFELIAGEARAEEIVRLLRDTGALGAAQPALAAPDRVCDAVARLKDVAPSHRGAVLFCLLLSEAMTEQAEAAIARLSLTGRETEAVRGFLALREQEEALGQSRLPPSEVVARLSSFPVPAVEAFALIAADANAREYARRYLHTWRYLRPRLNGRDLEALGVPHGPRVGEAIEALRAARLDGLVTTRDDEVAFVRERGFATPALAEARGG